MAEGQVSNINHEELIRKVDDLEKRLQTKDAEIQVYKMLMSQMEEEAAQAKKYKAIHEKQTQDVDSLRTESEKTLTKAKSMIFEKTKIIKNQELQIEAFTQQIESLREVVRITKDLLEIRNMEVKQLEIKIESIEGKHKAEKERYDLMHKKLEMMIRHNSELKREYETQLCLFTALRERYSERELAKDVIDNLKTDVNPALKIIGENGANNKASKEIKQNEEAKVVKTDIQKTENPAPNQEKPVETNVIATKSTIESNTNEPAALNTIEAPADNLETKQPETIDNSLAVEQGKIQTENINNNVCTEQIAVKKDEPHPESKVPVAPESSKQEPVVIEQIKQTVEEVGTTIKKDAQQEAVIEQGKIQPGNINNNLCIEQIAVKKDESNPVSNVAVVSESSKQESVVIEENEQIQTNINVSSTEQKTIEQIGATPGTVVQQNQQNKAVSEQNALKSEVPTVPSTPQAVDCAQVVKSPVQSDSQAVISVDANQPNKQTTQPINTVPVNDTNNAKEPVPALPVPNVEKKQ